MLRKSINPWLYAQSSTALRREQRLPLFVNGQIIEVYPGHRYGPCCLVHGRTGRGRHLHVVASLAPVWIITAYEPDPVEWIDHRTRR